MGMVNIGEFARLSRLSPKALRLYDELGLLPPAQVDPGTGYRRYGTWQLEQARLLAGLRRIGVPLAGITTILAADADQAAERIRGYWALAEADHAAHRALAGHLVDQLLGERPTMTEIVVQDLPTRSLLSFIKRVHSDELFSVGHEFIGRLRSVPMPRPEGIAGKPFVIYYGEVSADSDGPIEWCWPVADDYAAEAAARFPDITLRVEPAHQEASIHQGPAMHTGAAQAVVAIDALVTWAAQHNRQALGGVRQLYIHNPANGDIGPDCAFAVPLA